MLTLKEITTQAQISELFIIINEIWREVYTPIIGSEQVAYMMKHYQSEEKIQSEIEQGVHYYFIMYGDKKVGYTAYEYQGNKVYISKLYIHKAQRGKGLMSDIFNWYLTIAEGRPLFLNVNQSNEKAIAIYEHWGFKCIGERWIDIGEGYAMNDYIYER